LTPRGILELASLAAVLWASVFVRERWPARERAVVGELFYCQEN
jgi:hypothetical protein